MESDKNGDNEKSDLDLRNPILNSKKAQEMKLPLVHSLLYNI
jgi:hypothetical protein